MIARLPLEDAAISTSGDYERFFDEDGVRHHHIIDPKTGKSPHGVRSVTVIAPTATFTEGLTKSVFILGPEKGMALVERRPDTDAVVVTADGQVLYSKGLEPAGKNSWITSASNVQCGSVPGVTPVVRRSLKSS